MEFKKNIETSILLAVVELLKPSCPDINAEILVTALKEYKTSKPEERERLITRKVAADMLGVSLITFWRMEKSGAIKTVTLPTRGKRVKESDVKKLQSNN